MGGDVIARSQSRTLINTIHETEGAEIILLTGVAGSGKSGIVREAISDLKTRQIPHLAFRIDHHLDCKNREGLGKALLNREESPVSTLKGLNPDSTSVLFIDQVDAVSEVSGRSGAIKEVIFKLIADAHNFGNIKVVLVCRSFDLETDSRFRKLKAEEKTKKINTPILDWNNEVVPVLKKSGIKPKLFKPKQQKLLCLPINLSIFLEVNDSKFLFHSQSKLYEKLLDVKEQKILLHQTISWSLVQPLTVISNWMSKRQRLSAPDSILDDYPRAKNILSSEGLIILSKGEIYFFHESFFDFIYSRSFLKKEESVTELLLATEQHLFRRTQTRQILETLRQSDPSRYYIELNDVLFNNDVRFHVKVAISHWLGTLQNPTEKEFKMISKLDDQKEEFNQLFRKSVLVSKTWFDLLYDNGWIEQELDSSYQVRVDHILWWLASIASSRPEKVCAVLKSWWKKNKKRSIRLLNLISRIELIDKNQCLIEFLEDLIAGSSESLFNDQHFDNIDILLHNLSKYSPESCGRILRKLLDSWFKHNPSGIPYREGAWISFRGYPFDEIIKKNPEAVLFGTTKSLIQSIQRVNEEESKSIDWYELNRRTYSGTTIGFDAFLGIFRTALIKVSKEDSATAIKYLDDLDPNLHTSIMHLHLEAIQANPKIFGNLLLLLIENESIFDAGWDGANWYSFAQAYRKAIPYLKEVERKYIEEKILNYTYEINYAIQRIQELNRNGNSAYGINKSEIVSRILRHSGYKQWCILETVGEKNLSNTTQNQLYMLRRKFFDQTVPLPKQRESGFVPSPIERDRCTKMKDQDWLNAIKHYDGRENKKVNRSFFKGGARQLASELQELTKENSKRFSDLCQKIPDTSADDYIRHILWGLSNAEFPSNESLEKVIFKAHNHPQKPFGQEIARVISKHPQIASNPDILDVVLWYALNGTANHPFNHNEFKKDNDKIDIETIVSQSNGYYHQGINTVRGAAWEALASALWKFKDKSNQIWESLEMALNEEVEISVRCCMMSALVPLFNIDKKRFADSIRNLINLNVGSTEQSEVARLAPIITYKFVNLFPYIFNDIPDLADELVNELLNSGDDNCELIGAWLIYNQSFQKDAFIAKADNLISKSLNHRRLFASTSAKAIKWADNRDRVEVILTNFFFDDDKQVRENAAKVFRDIPTEEAENYLDIASAFIESPAFSESSTSLLYMLENATCDVLELVVNATQKIITDITNTVEKRGRKGLDAYKLQELLKREYSASESNPEARSKILDMIDLMLINEIFGVDKIVSAHDRW